MTWAWMAVVPPRHVIAVIFVVPLLVQVVLFEVVAQLDPQVGAPGRTVAYIDGRAPTDGELAVVVVKAVRRDGQLMEAIRTAHAAGGLSSIVDGGQQQSDEDGDDGDDN